MIESFRARSVRSGWKLVAVGDFDVDQGKTAATIEPVLSVAELEALRALTRSVVVAGLFACRRALRAKPCGRGRFAS